MFCKVPKCGMGHATCSHDAYLEMWKSYLELVYCARKNSEEDMVIFHRVVHDITELHQNANNDWLLVFFTKEEQKRYFPQMYQVLVMMGYYFE